MEGGGERVGGRGGERERKMWEKSIDQLLPICFSTRNQTHNLLVHRTVLQPTEPPGQGPLFLSLTLYLL